jgi:hypothetical protein
MAKVTLHVCETDNYDVEFELTEEVITEMRTAGYDPDVEDSVKAYFLMEFDNDDDALVDLLNDSNWVCTSSRDITGVSVPCTTCGQTAATAPSVRVDGNVYIQCADCQRLSLLAN